jgi:hypothetical protein
MYGTVPTGNVDVTVFATDYSTPDIGLSYMLNESGTWISLGTVNNATQNTFTIPSVAGGTYVSLMITATDTEDNSTTQTITVLSTSVHSRLRLPLWARIRSSLAAPRCMVYSQASGLYPPLTLPSCTGKRAREQSSAVQTLTGPGDFTAAVSGLEPGTTYNYKAKAVGDGTAYGEVKQFTTSVEVATLRADDTTQSSATVVGWIVLGGQTGAEVSFEYR